MLNYVRYLPHILEHYPLAIVHHEHLRTSENMVVKLVADNGVFYALRIRKVIASYHEQVMSELTFLRDLHQQSAAEIPLPIATKSNQLFCRITVRGESYVCILFSWVPGIHVGAQDISCAQMGAMAQAVSRLHNFSSGYNPPPDFVRSVYDEQWYFGPQSWNTSKEFISRLNPVHTAFLQTINETVSAYLRRYPRNSATFGLIHYDLHVGNFLFHDTIANMLDFDECGYGYYLFDLAHLLFDFIGDPRYDAFKNTATEQYAEARSMDRIPDVDLDMFLALQGVAYVNWLYRLFWRDGKDDALEYWVPIIVKRLKTITGRP
jgi:Ser/Thr protein kinase RdoA (MazF antagonist)